MKEAVVALLRNDAGQVLILERYPHDREYTGPCFPGGKVEATENAFNAIRREVREETGLEIAGLREFDKQVSHSGGFILTCFSAYVSGGKLLKYPTREHVSASWMAPSLALTLKGLGKATEAFLQKAVRTGPF